ncbi:hypothetical protein LSTR_LSTR006346 [Laodelphax striatellus]|uniref:Uncharacterized protein n=1 Tax=Laodelphax striatellus TaxID=195883 RepID=A0A482XCV0_LAOST|nr:hypothetical protein LSTR_LSTR006346 [Laodelphax striatellus]
MTCDIGQETNNRPQLAAGGRRKRKLRRGRLLRQTKRRSDADFVRDWSGGTKQPASVAWPRIGTILAPAVARGT